MDCLFIAWQYLRYHKLKTGVLVASISLMIYLPAGIDALVNESARQLKSRASQTPLVVGAKGSDVDLVLNSLYFESDPPVVTQMSQVNRIRETDFARAIPLYCRFEAQGWPIVGTELDYFGFRELSLERGRWFALMGECVLGAEVASRLRLGPGDSLLSSPESVFDLAGVYPLKMHVVGVLQPAGTPDDNGIFVDVKTTWVIQGMGHGHQDLNRPEAREFLLKKEGNQLTANAAVVNYTEITPENVHSFHFHGDPRSFPITAVIALPFDQKNMTLLMGRYQSETDSVQIVRPALVMDELLGTILRVRQFVIAGALMVGIATVLSVTLVFVLSLRLRQRELMTLAKLGCSRWRMFAIVAFEILTVVVVSVFIAGSLTMATRLWGDEAIHWFLL